MNRYDQKMRELKAIFIGYGDGENPTHVSEEEIVNVEQHLGATLPADYREFVSDFGKFGVPATVFPLLPNPERFTSGSLSYFQGIISNPNKRAFDLLSHYQTMVDITDGWRDNLLPSAIADGSSTVGLSFKGEDKGSVYFFVEFTYFFLVAESFDEFMQLLESRDEEPEAEEDAAEFWAQYQRAD